MPGPTDPRKVEKYWQLRKRGHSITGSSKIAGFSYATAHRLEDGLLNDSAAERRKMRVERQTPAPIPRDKLRPEALRALEDFGYFQERYFGCVPTPWQIQAANLVVEKLATPDKEYMVVNAPPGCGKTTLNGLYIPAWLICRNRAIRGASFSNSQGLANKTVLRLRRFLERTIPLRADPMDVAKGLAKDAVSTVADDFGTFKPAQRDIWSRSEFVVAQLDNIPIDEKESTWTAFGFDSSYLGMRLDVLIADDVVDKSSVRTLEASEKMKGDWDDVAERRLEPGGLLVLQGQRLSSFDLYAYCRDKVLPQDDEDEDISPDKLPRMYSHVVFKAHYDDRCEGDHKPNKAKPFPEGCLLDPRRCTWKEVNTAKANNQNLYHVVMQQEDTDPSWVLAKKVWVYGGTDPETGMYHPGCVDRDRDICELPRNLHGRLLSIATVDPSAAKWWSVQWWVARCDPDPQERYLMDLERRRMMGPDLLDWKDATRSFDGLMEAWQLRSKDLGLPITHWIIERNGCQRWLMQFEHTRRWMAKHGVIIMPHETNVNKLDKELGPRSLGPKYQFGLVRLPWKGNSTQNSAAAGGHGYIKSIKLINEVTQWPDTPTEDCVMAQWFFEFHLPKLRPRVADLPTFDRPSWMGPTALPKTG